MSRTLVSQLLCLTLAAGSAFPARAIYECSMTGKRSVGRCCCDPTPAARAGCSSCATTSVPHVASAPSSERPRTALASREMRLDRACCSVSYEEDSPRPSAALDAGWKRILSDGLLAAPFVPLVESALSAREVLTARDGGRIFGPGGVPLFIAHRALLL